MWALSCWHLLRVFTAFERFNLKPIRTLISLQFTLSGGIAGSCHDHLEIASENELKKYLTDQAKIYPDSVDVALRRLRAEGNAAIFHMMLTDDELVALGLK